MSQNKQLVAVYVQLLDEGTYVWRPTQAEVLGGGLYRLMPTEDYDPEDETWEFLPGSIVSCMQKTLMEGLETVECLVAMELIKPE